MTQRIRGGDLYWDHDADCSLKVPCARCEQEEEERMTTELLSQLGPRICRSCRKPLPVGPWVLPDCPRCAIKGPHRMQYRPPDPGPAPIWKDAAAGAVMLLTLCVLGMLVYLVGRW